ncbi:hypothetical protein CPB83DRAFT_647670 [Crepidotus variabilis]|uniref:Uncharacterized protein n=1 Tax=Crepidotus variabilis TaxID=179855 RepID=A0A9P6E7E1_9AGAR|nr:hypothetical protein CPB83DRAFT_647670 [Crepidotus variabilis]
MSLTALLSHLHNPASTLALQTLQGALAHHLSETTPTPTPLAATAISSPFYLTQPFTHAKLQSFSTAFRHATHIKYRALLEDSKKRLTLRTILGRSRETLFGQWVSDVFQGIQGGHPVLRLAACSGLLQGVEDVKIGGNPAEKDGLIIGSPRSAVENETIVALAEVMDTYSTTPNTQSSNSIEEWEREFQPAGQDVLSLALILASQSLPLVEQRRLEALPLRTLARLLTTTIASSFKYGTFLSSVSASVTLSSEKQVHVSPLSTLTQTLQSLSSSHFTTNISSISRLTATVLSLLIESPRPVDLVDNLYNVSDSLDLLREIAKTLEYDWVSSPLARFNNLEIAPNSKHVTQQIWAILKTYLFTTLMLSSSVLSASLYIPPRSSSCSITAATLALQTLHLLSHLSFIISQFGGVTTTTQGFEHLKRTFYMALDILAHSEGQPGGQIVVPNAEAYVQQVCLMLNAQRAESAATAPRQAKQAFVLASIEQVVPVLSDKCIRNWVWGICYPHLNDSSHRETYESAHSVVLAIFASYAQKQQQITTGEAHHEQQSPLFAWAKPWSDNLNQLLQAGPNRLPESRIEHPDSQPEATSQAVIQTGGPRKEPECVIAAKFIQRMIPFYAKCLIDNSAHGKLNSSQLRLAYAALVRSASVSTFTDSDMPMMVKIKREQSEYNDLVLAWYCIQLLLDTIYELSSTPTTTRQSVTKGKQRVVDHTKVPGASPDLDRVHRLKLVLVSTISSLPVSLMLRCLDEVRDLLLPGPLPPKPSPSIPLDKLQELKASTAQAKSEENRKELLEALFSELLEKTGDREKEAAVRWWYQYRDLLVLGLSGDGGDTKGSSSGWLRWRNKLAERSENDATEKKEEAVSEAAVGLREQLNPTVLSRL